MPINVRTGKIGDSILLPAIEANQIMPTNFLFDKRSGSLIIVGIKKITDAEQYPINIITVSEDSLLTEITFGSQDKSQALYYVLAVLLLAGLIGAFYLKRRLPQTGDSPKELPLTDQKIEQIDWLKTDEKILLKHLCRHQKYVESLKIDEVVWPDIDNYDYRRKLRNDIINSINKKFRNRLAIEKDVINRIKDPNDKRRFLYGLNDEFE